LAGLDEAVHHNASRKSKFKRRLRKANRTLTVRIASGNRRQDASTAGYATNSVKYRFEQLEQRKAGQAWWAMAGSERRHCWRGQAGQRLAWGLSKLKSARPERAGIAVRSTRDRSPWWARGAWPRQRRVSAWNTFRCFVALYQVAAKMAADLAWGRRECAAPRELPLHGRRSAVWP
jgi:hypothetical protein